MLCVIWYHMCNLKNVKNTHRGVLLLVNLQALACYERFESLTHAFHVSDLFLYPLKVPEKNLLDF